MTGSAVPAAIHPTSIVEDGAQLAPGVVIGPFCHVGPHVALEADVELRSHVVVAGRTRVGERTRLFPFASIGHEPQDLKYRGEPVSLTIGSDCLIREGVTINPGTAGGGGETTVGSHCAFLANAHVAHDCRLGHHIIVVNNVMVGGHVTIGDYAVLGGGCAIHQFVRVGAHAMIGGLSGVENDVIPFGTVLGNRAFLAGLNLVGLKRRGFTREAIHDLRRAYRLLFAQEGTLSERLDDVAAGFPEDGPVGDVVRFIRAGGDRAVCTPRDGKDGTG